MSAAERPSAASLTSKGFAAKGISSSPLRAFVAKNASPRVVACSVLLGIYVGAVLVLGRQLDSYSAVAWTLSTLCKVLAVAAVVAVASFAMFCLVRAKGYAEQGRAAKPTAKLSILTVIVLIVPQVFVWLVVFPGVYGYDGNAHLRFYFGQLSPITTQYSVIYTALLGVCAQLGGGATASIALAAFVQSAVSIYALYRLCLFVLKQTRSMVFFVASLLFSALFPFGLLLRVSTVQDVLFGAFFLLAVIELVKFGGGSVFAAKHRANATDSSGCLFGSYDACQEQWLICLPGDGRYVCRVYYSQESLEGCGLLRRSSCFVLPYFRPRLRAVRNSGV